MSPSVKISAQKKWLIRLGLLVCLLAVFFWAAKERKELLVRESARILESVANRGLGADVRIGRIRGNIFGMIAFENLEIPRGRRAFGSYGADAVIVFGVELSDGSDQPYCCLASVDYCNPLEQRISLRSV